MSFRSGSPPDAAAAPGGQRAVIEAARELRAAGRAFALVLVVEAQGSTYRKPGALALVAEDGTQVGAISGGCLEPGVVACARSPQDVSKVSQYVSSNKLLTMQTKKMFNRPVQANFLFL